MEFDSPEGPGSIQRDSHSSRLRLLASCFSWLLIYLDRAPL